MDVLFFIFSIFLIFSLSSLASGESCCSKVYQICISPCRASCFTNNKFLEESNEIYANLRFNNASDKNVSSTTTLNCTSFNQEKIPLTKFSNNFSTILKKRVKRKGGKGGGGGRGSSSARSSSGSYSSSGTSYNGGTITGTGTGTTGGRSSNNIVIIACIGFPVLILYLFMLRIYRIWKKKKATNLVRPPRQYPGSPICHNVSFVSHNSTWPVTKKVEPT